MVQPYTRPFHQTCKRINQVRFARLPNESVNVTFKIPAGNPQTTTLQAGDEFGFFDRFREPGRTRFAGLGRMDDSGWYIKINSFLGDYVCLPIVRIQHQGLIDNQVLV
jgi:hypothetical protein